MADLFDEETSLLQYLYDFYLPTLPPPDERTRGWLFVDSPVPTFLCVSAYLGIVWAGPKLMRGRRAFNLTWVLVLYNLALTVLSAYIFVTLLVSSTRLGYSYICQPIRDVDRPDELRIANVMWWYYFSKLIEFCDTFFFILRKKDNQLSFLHVYHHSTVSLYCWVVIKWLPSGSSIVLPIANCSIHILMYSYYGLAALGPTVAKYLWWKKYLTIMQIIQFILLIISGVSGILAGCDFSMSLLYTFVIYISTFLILFVKFYVKSYAAKDKRRTE